MLRRSPSLLDAEGAPSRQGPARAFTLIEMLVSMVVLALLVIAMMALVDSSTKLSFNYPQVRLLIESRVVCRSGGTCPAT